MAIFCCQSLTSTNKRCPVLLNPLFDRPRDGRINGHIKCNWPRKRQANQPLGPAPMQSGGVTQHITPHMSRFRPECPSSRTVYSNTAVSMTAQVQHRAPPSTVIESKFSGSTPSQATMANAPSSFQDVSAHAPPKLPPCFGRLSAWSKMDNWGKKALIFCKFPDDIDS